MCVITILQRPLQFTARQLYPLGGRRAPTQPHSSATAEWFDHAGTAVLGCCRESCGWSSAFHDRKPRFKPPTEQKLCDLWLFLVARAHAVICLMSLSSGLCSEVGRVEAKWAFKQAPSGMLSKMWLPSDS